MGTKLLLPGHIASELRCDLCRGYLSIPPISSHEEKFSCGRCNPGWPRNVIYEHLAQFVLFPCTYCEEQLPWSDVPDHEQKCRHNIILCPASYEKNYKLSKMPASNLGEYHKDCQYRTMLCPFEYCDSKYALKDMSPHFDKFHKGYLFTNNLVSARKILKEEKVWNFNPDTQVCLLVFKQIPFLLFVHSDCNYNEDTGDIMSYDYYFSMFSFCKNQCDVKYTVSVTLMSDSDNANFTKKNQTVLRFNERLHLVNFLRIGLIKKNSFNFMTTTFKNLKKSENLILTYAIKILDTFEPLAEKYPNDKNRLKVDSLGKNFDCPICKDYMYPPVFNCDLGHSVCKTCKMKMSTCPFCKASIGNSRNFVFEDILETLQITCHNESKGCAFSGKIQEIKLHELMCLYNVY
ncbi:hypothetical protein NQ314_003739 [Rhamnusium bicolor]|uniref:RING-type domain-containing protein n=1 Tax=Rhamnusium bicolor TaxID=1586634 RepID=A0AAV8ZLA1_9CUCU|nr:hypothetical protein NQ314_003739 [Rhamnusium bicolor]